MANNFRGGVQAGATSLSLSVVLYDNYTGDFKTGVAHTGITAKYWRQGSTAGTSISLSALAAINSAYSSGGWKEASATDHPGSYRLDIPNAMVATGADWVELSIIGPGIKTFKMVFYLDPMAVTSLGVVSAAIGAASITSSSFDTDALSSAAVSAAAANKIADALIVRTLGTESYAADNTVPNFNQMLFMIWSRLAQFDQAAAILTARKLNGTDSSMQFTMNAATNPTSITRTS